MRLQPKYVNAVNTPGQVLWPYEKIKTVDGKLAETVTKH